jgi:flagellar hook protein FlgE
MSDALLAGVSGLTAHQKMLDVVGNNLANIDTLGFKTSRVTFSELLTQTLKEGTGPTDFTGGTNPEQIGAGVGIGSIDRDMTQGSMETTNQPLDMAIAGEGFFVLSDGTRDLYTRVGAFGVDANNYLVDPATGYRVQRIGSEGVAEGFQDPASGDIRVPYDMALSARATETIQFSGNLSPDASQSTTAIFTSGLPITAGGSVASGSTKLVDIDGSTAIAGEKITVAGTKKDGTAVSADFTIAAGSTVDDLTSFMTTQFGGGSSDGSSATYTNGEIGLSDNTAGYSQTDLTLT